MAGGYKVTLEDVEASIRRDVAQGFDPPEQLRRVTCEVFKDDFPGKLLEREVPRMLRQALRDHLDAQRQWPAETDCDRLDRAFADLERAGIVARQNFSCCGTCASSEIVGEMEQVEAAGRAVRGYTSYDVQSTESAVEGGGIALNYGNRHQEKKPGVAIGHEIVDALARHGLRVQWDGTWARRILVDLEWKRRRPESDLQW